MSSLMSICAFIVVVIVMMSDGLSFEFMIY